MPRKLADAPKYQQPRAAESPKFHSAVKVHVSTLEGIPVAVREIEPGGVIVADQPLIVQRTIRPYEVHPPLIPPPSGALHDGGRVVLDACVIAVFVTMIAVMLYTANGWYQHTGYSPQELCQVRYNNDCTVRTIDGDVTVHVNNSAQTGSHGKRYYTISTPSSTAHP